MTDSHAIIADGIDALTALTPIRQNSVTPHLTHDGAGFRLRHLSFDEGAVLASHAAPDPVVISVVHGHVVFQIDGVDHDLTQGAVITVDRDIPHEVRAVEPSRLQLILVG